MTSFGSWYEQQQRVADNGDNNASSSEGNYSSLFFSSFAMDSEQVLPLFHSENLPGFSFESMKQSMEAQMPKKILGMGYQQRFKVSLFSWHDWNWESAIHGFMEFRFFHLSHMWILSLFLVCSCFFSLLGILCLAPSVGIILCVGLFRGCTRFNDETTKICLELYLWITYLYG